jgi:hypothetical protein
MIIYLIKSTISISLSWATKMMGQETVGTVLLMSFGARNYVLHPAEKLKTVVLIVGVACKIVAIQTN